RLPYEAVSLSELTLKQQREAPQRLDVLNPDVPRELAQAVSMALSIDAAARPSDAMVFAEALQNGLRGHAPVSDTSPTAHLGTRAAPEVLADRSPPTAATRVAAAQAPAPRTRQPP